MDVSSNDKKNTWEHYIPPRTHKAAGQCCDVWLCRLGIGRHARLVSLLRPDNTVPLNQLLLMSFQTAVHCSPGPSLLVFIVSEFQDRLG